MKRTLIPFTKWAAAQSKRHEHQVERCTLQVEQLTHTTQYWAGVVQRHDFEQPIPERADRRACEVFREEVKRAATRIAMHRAKIDELAATSVSEDLAAATRQETRLKDAETRVTDEETRLLHAKQDLKDEETRLLHAKQDLKYARGELTAWTEEQLPKFPWVMPNGSIQNVTCGAFDAEFRGCYMLSLIHI